MIHLGDKRLIHENETELRVKKVGIGSKPKPQKFVKKFICYQEATPGQVKVEPSGLSSEGKPKQWKKVVNEKEGFWKLSTSFGIDIFVHDMTPPSVGVAIEGMIEINVIQVEWPEAKDIQWYPYIKVTPMPEGNLPTHFIEVKRKKGVTDEDLDGSLDFLSGSSRGTIILWQAEDDEETEEMSHWDAAAERYQHRQRGDEVW